MMLDHSFMVLLAKSFGLICFIVASGLVLYYSLRPSVRDHFENVGRSIIVDEDDRPAAPGAGSTTGEEAIPASVSASSTTPSAGESDGRR